MACGSVSGVAAGGAERRRDPDQDDGRHDDDDEGRHELPPAERPDEAVPLALMGEVGSFRHSDPAEVEVARQQRQPVEDHREADERHEQPADERHGAPVADQRSHDRRRAVVNGGDRDEREPEARGCRRRAGSCPGGPSPT